jgi:autotransporter-associated beta strand protein
MKWHRLQRRESKAGATERRQLSARLELEQLENRVLPSFSLGGTFSVGSAPAAVAVAHLTHDGHPDLITANVFGTVSILLGNGNGTFSTAQNIAVGTIPSSLAVADLTGNGELDLIAADSFASDVNVLMGNGNGTFQPALNFAVGSSPSFVAVADLNGDGHPDIITANQSSNSLSVLLGNGDATFKPAVNFTVGIGPSSVAVAELYGDGHPDLIAANYASDNVSLLQGNGDGTFKAAQNFAVGGNPSSLAVADVNADGQPDVLTANRNTGTVSLLLGNGHGGFQAALNLTVGGNPSSLAVADVNGDGHPDLITANYQSGNVNVLLGNGDGTFMPATNYFCDAHASAVAVADINGDGSPDLVVANEAMAGYVSVLLNNSAAPFALKPAQTFPAGAPPTGIKTADVNGDGKPDLIVQNYLGFGSDAVSVLLGNGDGTFQAPITTKAYSYLASFAVADLNGDGKPDLVTSETYCCGYSGGNFSVHLGNGNGTFKSATNYYGGYSPLLVADFNGDGHPDLLATGVNPIGSIQGGVYLGNGNGTFQGPISYSYGPAVAVGDFNGDGKVDVVTSNGVLLGNGNGTFQKPIGPFLNGILGAGDFTGDGKLDLVSASGLLLGNGNGTFRSPISFPAGVYPSSVATADLNGDGSLDLVVGNVADGTVDILLGNGNGTFQGPLYVPLNGNSFTSFTVGDFNGDGTPSIAGTYASGRVGVLLGVTNAVTSFAVSAPSKAIAGTSIQLTVTALNGSGLVDSAYTGTVSFRSTDPIFSFSPYTFTAADQGVHTFTVTLKTAGTATITASDNGNPTITGVSNFISVDPAAASELLFKQQPSNSVAGQSINPSVTVQVADAFGNLILSDSSQVSLALGTNPGGSTLSGTTQISAVNGIATFNNLSLNKSGTGYTLNASDGSLLDATSGSFNIGPAAPASLALTAPSSIPVGQAFSITVTVLDAFANVATGYQGIVHFSSTDSGPALPANYTFMASDQGIHTFSATLRSAGTQTVTVQDVNNPLLTQSVAVTVTTTETDTLHWTGNALDNKWSNPANWLEGLVPDSGDSLVFPDGAATFNPTNDLAPGMTFNSITFTGTNGGYSLAGNPIILTSGIAGNGAGSNTVSIGMITLEASQTFTAGTSTLTFTSASAIALNGFTLTLDGAQESTADSIAGVISGTGAILKNGASDWQLQAANTFTGSTTINAGTLTLSNNNSLGAASNTATVLGSDPSNPGSLQVDLKLTIAQNLTINGSGNSFSAGSLHIVAANGTGTDTFSGLTLNSASELFSESGSATVFLTGPIQNNGFNLTIQGVFNTVLTGAVSGTGNVIDFGNIFSGSGSVSGALNVNQGVLSPGVNGPGTLTSGSVTFNTGTSFQVALAGTNTGQFSQLVVNGSANLSGSSLQASLSNFTPTAGESFVILTATGGINGTFSGLPDGSIFSVGGQQFIITYVTNSPKDTSGGASRIVLSVIPAPTVTTVSIATAAPVAGENITLTATVSLAPSAAGGGAARAETGLLTKAASNFGTVTFVIDNISQSPIFLGDSPLNNGTASLVVILTLGTHTITAQYNGDPNGIFQASPVGSAPQLLVGAAAASTFRLSAPTTTTAGNTFSITVTALDSFGNTATGYTGTVHFGSSDGQAGLPGDYTFVSADNGQHTFTVTLQSAGSQTISAIDTVTSSITGMASLSVSPAAVGFGNPNPGDPIYATGADAGGGPQVNVYDAKTNALIGAFFAYDTGFLGGVRVAVGDVNGDGVPDIITAPGPGGGPDIRVFDGKTGLMIGEFLAYDYHFDTGIYVAATDLNRDGHVEIITAPDQGGGPDVRIFDGKSILTIRRP